MNSDHLLSNSTPDRACAAFDTLYTQRLLNPEADQTLRIHVAGCADCRARLAAYEHLDNALRRQVAPLATIPFRAEDIMHSIQPQERFVPQGSSEAPPPPFLGQAEVPAPRLRQQGLTRRPVTWLAASAAVLVIALLTTALFVSHRLAPAVGSGGNQAQPTAPLSMYVSTPTDASPGSASTSTYGLTALAASTGQVRWHYTNGSVPISTVALVGGVLYADSRDGQIFAFRASDGKRLWSFQALHYFTSVQVVQGVVYVGSMDGKTLATSTHAYTYALAATSGKELWRFTLGGFLEQIGDGAVYVATGSSATLTTVYALNARDGSVKWTIQDYVWVWQAVGGMVYMVQNDPSISGNPSPIILEAFDAGTGKQLWSFPKSGTLGPTRVLDHGVIYLTANEQSIYQTSDTMYALDASSGLVRWHTYLPLGDTGEGTLVSNGVLFAGSDAFDTTTGKSLWHAPLDMLSSPAALVDGVLYGFSNQTPTPTNIFALHANDGSVKWQRKIDGNAFLHIDAVSNGVIYADQEAPGWPQPTASHGVAYAFNATDGSVRWSYDLGTSGINAPTLIG